MQPTDPFFSIIIPTYNRAALIGQTLQSVLDQRFSSFEVIVVDDGGKDNTEEVLRALNNDRVQYYRKENGERGAARNYGWGKARGTYVTFLDSDDVLYPNHLEEAHHLILSKDVPCFAQAYEIKEASSGKVLRPAYLFQEEIVNERIAQGNFLSCFGVFVKRDIYPQLGFEEDRRFAGTEDWLLWLQLAARYPFYYHNKVTGALLEHDSRSVLSFKEESLVYRAEGLRKKLEGDEVFVRRFGKEQVSKIYAHMLSYTSLHIAMGHQKRKALHYFIKAIGINFNEMLTRRGLSIIKKILFS